MLFRSFEDDVFVGPFVEIQNDVKIGSGTRVQSHSFICSQVKIGKDCFIGHGVMFTNDDLKKGKITRKALSPLIEYMFLSSG